jgi:hypothetical protein
MRMTEQRGKDGEGREMIGRKPAGFRPDAVGGPAGDGARPVTM